ncbi:MAG: peptide deformylase [Bacteroidetes bacterium GWF2_40_14]|nr:MAG: peptide deformylase [Bacteroidetes bacterium GWF2_40_14]
MFFAFIAISLCLFSCTKPITFTQSELDLIGMDSTAGIMRLFVVDNPTDTLVLKSVSSDLTTEDIKSDYYNTLKKRMMATVLDTANAGVGIAAPQVGINKRVVAVQRLDKEGEPFEFYANIRFVELSKECKWGWEGCLSVPGKRDTVQRSTRVVISFIDEKTFTEKKDTIEGFTAVIFQHEVDHLEGILYTDRAQKQSKLLQ